MQKIDEELFETIHTIEKQCIGNFLEENPH